MNSPRIPPRDDDAASEDILGRIRRLHWCGIYTRQSRGPKDDYSSRRTTDSRSKTLGISD